MDAALRAQLEHKLEQADTLIIASESWSGNYDKDPATHNRLIRLEAQLARLLRGYFRDMATNIRQYVNYSAYTGLVRADFTVDTVINETWDAAEDAAFVTVVFDTVAEMYATGAAAGEAIYSVPLGIQSTDAIIQKLTTDRVAYLVGKKVDKLGNIVDNPNAKYAINQVTRDNIANSIKTSINLGENIDEMVARLQKTIKNPARAAKIAATESVNAYNAGLLEFGSQSGAVGKESQDVASKDYCRGFANEGIVPLDHKYADSFSGPAYHPGCRCGLRLVYQNELDGVDD